MRPITEYIVGIASNPMAGKELRAKLISDMVWKIFATGYVTGSVITSIGIVVSYVVVRLVT